MNRTARRNARLARRMIRTTVADWSPAYRAMILTGTPASVAAFKQADDKRYAMAFEAATPGNGMDHARLRRTLASREWQG